MPAPPSILGAAPQAIIVSHKVKSSIGRLGCPGLLYSIVQRPRCRSSAQDIHPSLVYPHLRRSFPPSHRPVSHTLPVRPRHKRARHCVVLATVAAAAFTRSACWRAAPRACCRRRRGGWFGGRGSRTCFRQFVSRPTPIALSSSREDSPRQGVV